MIFKLLDEKLYIFLHAKKNLHHTTNLFLHEKNNLQIQLINKLQIISSKLL